MVQKTKRTKYKQFVHVATLSVDVERKEAAYVMQRESRARLGSTNQTWQDGHPAWGGRGLFDQQ
jgi:hypothetical protein